MALKRIIYYFFALHNMNIVVYKVEFNLISLTHLKDL